MSSEKTRGIIIGHVNYSETSVVCNIYTREHGLLGFMLKGIRQGKGAIKNSHIMPLNLVDIVFDKKPNQQLYILKELRCNPLLLGLHGEMHKNSLVIFLSEVLQKTLYREHIDEHLFDFIEEMVLYINHTENISHIPVFFLTQLASFTGFKPKGRWQEEEALKLDIIDGIFTDISRPEHPQVPVASSKYIYNIMNRNIDSLDTWNEPYSVRAEALNGMVNYFQYHILHQKKIVSHHILHEILK